MIKQCAKNAAPSSDRDTILYNLGKRGYMLTGIDYEIDKTSLPTHKLIIDVLKAKDNARLIEGLSIVIDNDPPKYDALVRQALRSGLQNQVGYLLEGTLKVLRQHKPYTNTSELENAIKILYKEKLAENQLLARLDIPNEREVLSRNRFPEDIKWNVIGGVSYKQFDVQYRVYNNEASKYKKRDFSTS
jgi:hypothetical protein